MSVDFTQRCAEEARTHELFDTCELQDKATVFLGIRRTFVACWSESLSLDKIILLTRALTNVQLAEDRVARELKRLVRAGVLRSRMNQGRRFWEVNY